MKTKTDRQAGPRTSVEPTRPTAEDPERDGGFLRGSHRPDVVPGPGSSSTWFCNTKPNVSNRDKRGIVFIALGLSVIGVGVATHSVFLTSAGLGAIATTLRYRKTLAAREYLCFIALTLVVLAWSAFTGLKTSPLLASIPLMFSYIFDYLDERRQERTVAADATVTVGASDGVRLAQTGAAANAGLSTPSGSAGITEAPQSVR